MRVCTQISTGRFIEAQSDDAASMDSLLENAVNAGYDPADLSFSIVSAAVVYATIAKDAAKNAPPAEANPIDLVIDYIAARSDAPAALKAISAAHSIAAQEKAEAMTDQSL